jgi:polyhydroxybutyrate depolymerase
MKTFTFSILLLVTWVEIMNSQGNGQYLQFSLNVDGLTREYTLYVPEGHDGTEDWPVVFLFHGYTDPINRQISISQMYPVADTAKFLIVYPQGLIVYPMDVSTSGKGWNVPGGYVAEQNDVVFVSRIIDDLNSDPNYAIDLKRIYATGYSNGGEFSFYLGWALNHRFAAVSGISAQMNNHLINNICIPSRQISVLHMQGTSDVYFPINGDGYSLPLKGVAEYWAGINNCNANPDSTDIEDINQSDNSTVTLFNYSNCQDDNEVLLYRVNGGGHTWPGGWQPDGWEAIFLKINKDIHASIEVWNFFKKFENPYVNMAFGQKIEISPFCFDKKEDTLVVNATLSNPHNHPVNVFAIIQGDQSQFIDSLSLFNDGLHHDGDSLDNVWGNTRLVSGLPEDEFTVDLYTCDLTYGDTLRFHSPARFFTLGPVEFERYFPDPDFFCGNT